MLSSIVYTSKFLKSSSVIKIVFNCGLSDIFTDLKYIKKFGFTTIDSRLLNPLNTNSFVAPLPHPSPIMMCLIVVFPLSNSSCSSSVVWYAKLSVMWSLRFWETRIKKDHNYTTSIRHNSRTMNIMKHMVTICEGTIDEGNI